MSSLLSKISDKLNRTKPAALIGNIITNIITNQPTTLQITLAVVLNRKSLIEEPYDSELIVPTMSCYVSNLQQQ